MNFRRWVVFTFLIHALVVVVDKGGGLILYLLTANQAAEHGKSGIAASLPFILGAIANLGLATALVYFVRRKSVSAQTAFETSMWVAVVWGGFVAVASALFTIYVLPWMNPDWQLDWFGVLPICAVVPLLLYVRHIKISQDVIAGMPRNAPSSKAFRAMEEHFPAGLFAPFYLVATPGEGGTVIPRRWTSGPLRRVR